MERVIAYIDGFNLYFGLKAMQWQRFYWLNVQLLTLKLLKPHQELVSTKYFTSRVFENEEKQKRQTAFIEALETLCGLEIFHGKYYHAPRRCKHCGKVSIVPNEKMTDVNIATQLLTDAFQDRFDLAILISGDSDLVAPILAVRNLLPHKRILLAFPPRRFSKDLARLANNLVIGRSVIARSQSPPEVQKADGFILKRPKEWSQ